MRKIFVSALAALLLVACGQGQKSDPSRSEEAAQAAVEQIYETYISWADNHYAATASEGPESFFGPMIEYVTTEFCEAYCQAQERSNALEDLWLDSDPWINAQDCQELSLVEVQMVAHTPEAALADVTFMNMGEQHTTRVSVIYDAESGKWLVDDLYQESQSVKQLAIDFCDDEVVEEIAL